MAMSVADKQAWKARYNRIMMDLNVFSNRNDVALIEEGRAMALFAIEADYYTTLVGGSGAPRMSLRRITPEDRDYYRNIVNQPGWKP